jgi:hypothetical protein
MIRFAEETGLLARGLGVQIVSPCGELLLPSWRSLLAQTFDAPVYDRLSATESGALAWECPVCGAYHANTDEIVVEPKTDIGCIVTPLCQRAQPLLRYNLGDQLRWDNTPRSPCDIALPKVRILEGRRDDWLYDGYNKKVSPLAFEFEQYDFVKSWSIWQKWDGQIEVYIGWEGAGNNGRRSIISRHVADVIHGRPIIVRDKIENNISGKFKRIKSDYHPDHV